MCTQRCVLKVWLYLLPWFTETCQEGELGGQQLEKPRHRPIDISQTFKYLKGCGFRPDYDAHPSSTSNHTFYQSSIIGSKASLPGEWPWTVSLQIQNHHFCGGSILNSWWILTAAHCFQNEIFLSNNLRVEAGVTTLRSIKDDIEVKKIITHAFYDSKNLDNDIALLLLSTPIRLNPLKTPICLPPPGEFSNEDWWMCYMTGWDTNIVERPVKPQVLQKVEIVLLDWNLCKIWLWSITKNMICAGYEDKSRDTCQGDSGGPLVCRSWKNDIWYQVGIVSRGQRCTQKKRPGIYTEVSKYLNWIETVTDEAGHPFVLEDSFEEESSVPGDVTYTPYATIYALTKNVYSSSTEASTTTIPPNAVTATDTPKLIPSLSDALSTNISAAIYTSIVPP